MINLRQLNFHHLHYFWVVANEGNLTRAAKKLHVAQSALSSQIRKLETQMGHDLFNREGKTLQLTQLGVVVLDYAEGIFTLGNELMSAVSGGEGQTVQQLRVGAVSTISRNFQENFLRPILGQESIQLILESGNLEHLLERLGHHKLDLVLSNKAVASASPHPWRCKRVARQSVCLVGPPRKPRARKFRFPQDIAKLRLLLPGKSNDIRGQFDSLCEDMKINIQIMAEVDDMAMLRLLTRDFGGVAVVPEVVVQDELKSGALQKYCVVPKVYENFYSITTRRHFQPTALRTLLGP